MFKAGPRGAGDGDDAAQARTERADASCGAPKGSAQREGKRSGESPTRAHLSTGARKVQTLHHRPRPTPMTRPWHEQASTSGALLYLYFLVIGSLKPPRPCRTLHPQVHVWRLGSARSGLPDRSVIADPRVPHQKAVGSLLFADDSHGEIIYDWMCAQPTVIEARRRKRRDVCREGLSFGEGPFTRILHAGHVPRWVPVPRPESPARQG